jgi:hypothetical protein
MHKHAPCLYVSVYISLGFVVFLLFSLSSLIHSPSLSHTHTHARTHTHTHTHTHSKCILLAPSLTVSVCQKPQPRQYVSQRYFTADRGSAGSHLTSQTTGFITDTHQRRHQRTVDSYLPSPVIYPLLLSPLLSPPVLLSCLSPSIFSLAN